jgi:hypothetical protein
VSVDTVLPAVLQYAPSWGVGGLLISIIVIMIRRESRVEVAHAAALDRQDRLHAATIERLNRDHDAELAELNVKIRDLRRDIDALDRQLSLERTTRLGLSRRGVASLDVNMDNCTATVHYTDGTDEVKHVSGGCDGTSDAS